MLLIYLLRHVCQLIKEAKEKEVSEKCLRMVEIKKEIDEKVDVYEKKKLRSKYIKLMN